MPTRLAVVPEAPLRAIGYIRVSTARDDMVSPELQLTAISDHCAARGYVLVDTINDLDLTGRFWRRRQAERAVTMIEAGDADVIVLWKWSRLTRNRRDWAVAVDRVEVAGGKLESATEPIDVSTSSGRLARGMLAEFAAFESDRIGDVWKEVHARRTKQGLPANGKPRFGYRVVDGIHRPDPETGPVLASLYRRYIAGESIYALAVWLNLEGIRTVAGYSKKGPGPWSQSGLRETLDRGFGAGWITVQGERQRGIHEPVITEAEWDAYQATRDLRRTFRRRERSPYLLSGLVWCGCGSKMGGGQWGRTAHAGMRCLWSTEPGATRHPGAYVRMGRIEEHVEAWVRELATSLDTAADAELARSTRAARRRQDADTLDREIVEVEKALTRLAVQRATANDPMPASVYDAARDELLERRDALLRRARIARVDAVAGEPSKVAADLLARWDSAPVEILRGLLQQLVARVTVTTVPPVMHVQVTPRWGGDIG